MLSNQMRGRAIRVWPDNPNKTSNIWHLVSINLSPRRWFDFQDEKEKYDETLELQLYALSPDLDLLDRRMTQFLGLHYQEPTIESGIDRLDLNQITFSRKGLEKLNQNAITLSQKRQELKDRWPVSYTHLSVSNKNEIGDSVKVTLVMEIMGKHSNIILTDKNESKIIESIKHVGFSQNSYRTILPGSTYICLLYTSRCV